MADLMTLAKGLNFDIGRLVMERVKFKRSYDLVIRQLNQDFSWSSIMDKYDLWGMHQVVVGIGRWKYPSARAEIRRAEYLYLQVYKGRTIDNVRSSYLIRTSYQTYDKLNAEERGSDQNSTEVWDEIVYYQSLALSIWYYGKEDPEYTEEHDLFYPIFQENQVEGLLSPWNFNDDGMDKWL